MNIVVIAGNLGEKPELRETQTGRKVCNLRVPTNRRWLDKDNVQQEATDWINITVWDKQAIACADNLDTGRWVNVEARLRERDRKVGEETVRVLEVVAKSVQFGPKGTAQPTQPSGPTVDTDSIPPVE